MAKYFFKIAASIIAVSMTGCGGGGEASPQNDEGISIVTDTKYENSVTAANAKDFEGFPSNNVSIAIWDQEHVRPNLNVFSSTDVVDAFDDALIVNDEIERGVYARYDSLEDGQWAWAEHGTNVAQVITGSNIGLADNFTVIPVLNLNRISLDEGAGTRYFDNLSSSLTADENGTRFDGNGYCWNKSENTVGSQACVSTKTYPLKEIFNNATRVVPSINRSVTSFSNWLKGDELSYSRLVSENDAGNYTYYSDTLGELSGTYGLRTFEFEGNVMDYKYLRELLTSNESVIVYGAANSRENITDIEYLSYHTGKYETVSPYSNSVANIYDERGVQGDGLLGLTDLTVVVGALDNNGLFASSYSNYPGGEKKVQANFITAKGTYTFLNYSGEFSESRFGTSYAAPAVSASIALLKSKYGNQYTGSQIKTALLYAADRDFPEYDPFYYGQGRLDVGAADKCLEDGLLDQNCGPDHNPIIVN